MTLKDILPRSVVDIYTHMYDRMSSVCFQGKLFNMTVIKVYAPTNNTEEAEVEWFYEDLQDPK